MTLTWMDRMGSIASATCAAHCFVLSVAPALLSLVGLEFLRHEAFEWGLFALALSVAVLAAGLGYRVHRSPWVLGSFVAGISVLGAGRLGEALELYAGAGFLAILGGVILLVSHLRNMRCIRGCREGSCSP